jgi:hypothetical protein
MRMGAAMMRFGSHLYLTPALIGLIMFTVLSLGAIVVGVITVSEHGDARRLAAPGNGGRVTLDIGVADLRGSLP